MEQQIITAWAQVAATVVIGLGQLGMIGWGLRQLGQASNDRNRQLDIMESSQREQSRVQAEALRDQGQGLGQIGQALERQGEAMTKAFTQQGEVLAELLRRTA